MPRRLLFALLLLVAAPLVLLGWLSASAYQQQQRQAREQLTRFFESRLAEIDRSLAEVFDSYRRSLQSELEDQPITIDRLRQLDRENPIVRSSIFVNKSGVLIHPPRPQPEQAEKVALFAALPAIIGGKPDLGKVDTGDTQAAQQPLQAASSKGYSTRSAVPPNFLLGDGRWQVWYMDEGVQLIYWMPRSDGAAIGVLLERARWIADLTAKLPDTIAGTANSTPNGSPALAESGFTVLADEAGRTVYRWGNDEPRNQNPLASRNLSQPLSSWKLEYHSRDPLDGAPSTAFLVASIVGIAIVLLSLGGYVLTSVQRQMRSARQRVSFASQVSHELRTPLTNIRLYAELAENDLQKLSAGETKDSLGQRLQVIDTESRRLGRLVSGVLELIRDPRKQRQPRIAEVVPDEVIDQTLTQFAPSFEQAALRIDRCAEASQTVGIDADILELILVNLLSNVEKYASSGGSVTVRSRTDGDQLIVDVFDHGPGIPWHHRRRVFRPFTRLDDSIQAPSGTGIGLTIARQLARRHGGDLELVEDENHRGACFRLNLRIELKREV